MTFSKKLISAAAIAIGLGGLMVAPVTQAGRWHHGRYYHWAGTRVRFRGCRKIVVRRYCNNGWRFNRCYRVRRVRWVC